MLTFSGLPDEPSGPSPLLLYAAALAGLPSACAVAAGASSPSALRFL